MVEKIRERGIENIKFSKIENSVFEQYLEEFYSDNIKKNKNSSEQ